MIRIECVTCKKSKILVREDLRELADLIGQFGPSKEHHMVLRYDCSGDLGLDAISEGQGSNLCDAWERIDQAKNVEELFGE